MLEALRITETATRLLLRTRQLTEIKPLLGEVGELPCV